MNVLGLKCETREFKTDLLKGGMTNINTSRDDHRELWEQLKFE